MQITVPPRFDDPSNQRPALSASKQHWSSVSVASCTFIRRLWKNCQPPHKLVSALTAPRLRPLALTFLVQTKSWQERYILLPKLGLSTSYAGGGSDLQT